ncbi:MAG: thymidine phosphorylase [Acidimicrobiia bacterium]|nr:thymidine phosphorylase [Acidimicrobiia bacterium]
MTFSMVEQIRAKREGETLSPEALQWIIAEYTADRIPDYQMSAFLMAVIFRGMNQEELGPWTEAMLHSGDVLDLSAVRKQKVDKHSTGGVGDKISIPLAPIVAACGVAVPMMSGRGLGHTGGTLDKLESIPGFTTQISPEAFDDQLNDIGVVMVGQTERLVPADRQIYALRDASGTVPSIPLIASSIMSKKLAEDLDGLLLDVKVGSGAFMKSVSDATELAETMAGIGATHNTPVTALLTNMDQPLGHAVGNANEIAESVDVLRGKGPSDVTELTTTFATEMLLLAGETDRSVAKKSVVAAIASGAAYDVFVRLVERQGGDPAVIEDTSLLPSAPNTHTITATSDGFVTRCDAYEIGMASVRLGAGRAKKGDEIDAGVGIMIETKLGDSVVVGQSLATVRYRSEESLTSALSVLKNTFGISEEPVPVPDLILGEVR